MILPIFITALKSYFNCVFSYIAANFGTCYGFAIGISITAVVEIIYWIVLKPFGFEKQDCKRCKEKAIHHYDSCISKKIITWVQIISMIIFLVYTVNCFYVLAYKAYNPPQLEEYHNQVKKPESYFLDFLF